MISKKEKLALEIYNYLCYDQKGDSRFHNPFEENNKHWDNVQKDAYALADIAMKYIDRKELV